MYVMTLRHTFVSGSETKVKTNENIVTLAIRIKVPDVLSGEAGRRGNNCAGMNAASQSALEVSETAIPACMYT